MKDKKLEKKIVFLTDDLISMYSKNNVLTDYHDVNLKASYPEAVRFGVYDPKIFGSMFTNTCNCGSTRVPGVQCVRCKSTLLDPETAFSRYARIEMPIMYCNELRIDNLIRFLKKHFNFRGPDGYTKLNTKILEMAQFDWNDEDDCIEFSFNVTNHRNCSYEGLLSIIYDHAPDIMEEYKAYVNYYILVLPIRSRLPLITYYDNQKRLNNDALTTIYKNLIYVIKVYYKEKYPTLTNEYDKNMMNACLRRMASKLVSHVSSLLNTSKENLSRTMQGNRLPDSGRCTIVPAPDLRVDQVAIPRHLMYEACRVEFTKYLSDTLNIPEDEAKLKWKIDANTKKIQDIFDDFINGDESSGRPGKYVIINRAPEMRVSYVI